MKRITALLLFIAVLACAGCGKTAAPEVSSPGPAETTSQYEPEEGAPARSEYAQYDILGGIYLRANLPEDAGYEEVLQIYPLGDILLLEYSTWQDGSMYEFVSMDEFWPDTIQAPGGEDFCAVGTCQRFSDAYDLNNYCGGATDCSITRTDSGVIVQRTGEDAAVYRSAPLHDGAHRTLNDCLAPLYQAYDPMKNPQVAGRWAHYENDSMTLLELREDGMFLCLKKQIHRPAKLYSGGWIRDSVSDDLYCTAERVGVSPYPMEFRLEWEDTGYDCLRIKDTSGQVLSDSEQDYYPYLWDWSTGYPQELLQCRVADAFDESGEYLDKSGNSHSYSYRLPEILCGPEDTELQQINREIQEAFAIGASESRLSILEGGAPTVYEVGYEMGETDGMVMLLCWSYPVEGNGNFLSYCFDTESGRRLDNHTVLERLGLSEAEYLEALRVAAVNAFLMDNGSHTDHSNYSQKLGWTASGEAIDVDLPVIVDENGEVIAAVPVASLEADGWYYAVVYPYSGAKG